MCAYLCECVFVKNSPIPRRQNSRYRIIRNLAKRWRWSCKPRHAKQRNWQYPDRVDKRLFSSIENVSQVLQKSLSFSIKHRHVLIDTILIYWDIWLHFQHMSGLCHPIQKCRILALILFITVAFQYGPETNKSTISMRFSALYVELAYWQVGRILATMDTQLYL